MRRLSLPLICLAAILMFASCESVKRFLSRDLEEEDYSLGELYVDEYVKEVPYVPTVSDEARRSGNVNALGIERGPDDNEELYNAIQTWMGTPYRYGGTDKKGVDCSGFVGHIYRKVYNINLHRVANDMQEDVTLISKSELREGDIVFFTNSKGRVSHVGIYLKDGLFVHSKCQIRRRNIGEAIFLPVLFNAVPKLSCNLQCHCLVRHRGRSHLVKNAIDQLDTQVVR